MPRSMTAFARCSSADAVWVCECRSVNHRFLDLSLRLPERQRALEPKVRALITERFGRGKVDLRLSSQRSHGGERVVDETAAAALSGSIKDVSAKIPGLTAPSVLDVLAWPGVLVDTFDENSEDDASLLLELVGNTIGELDASRVREGDALAEVLRRRLHDVRDLVVQLADARPEVRQRQSDRLRKHIESLDVEMREDRLEQEVVLALMRHDIDEELDRLAHHIDETERVLTLDEPVGRRLDFLMQEFNREVNTICSKSDGVGTTEAGVELKVLVEQMREQVQNLE